MCSVDGCPNVALARLLCQKHYMRWYTTGTVELPAPVSSDDRFWSKVNKQGPIPEYRPDLGGCWLWLGHKEPGGHGVFWLDGANTPAHRFSYESLVGATLPWPAHHIDHLCRVPACVNPEHLELVTARENTLRQPRNVNRTHCNRGHAYAGNRNAAGKCKVCHREREAIRRQLRKQR